MSDPITDVVKQLGELIRENPEIREFFESLIKSLTEPGLKKAERLERARRAALAGAARAALRR